MDFNFTPGSGAVGAADEIGGVLYPRVKVTHGETGSSTDVSTASPLPVQMRDSSGTEIDLAAQIGAVDETAPASDTASSGLNGRLQRIAQRITSFIALIPAALTGSGNFKVSLEESNASQAVTVADGSSVTLGAKTDAKSTATDSTSITIMQVLKQVSASVQAAAASLAGTLATSVADGSHITFGAKADAKSTATDTTSISAMSVWKQISASVQAIATSVAGTLIATVAGGVAHDGADSGNPVKVGAFAASTEPTAVANQDRTNLIATLTGKLINHPYANPENFVSGAITTAMTATTSTSLLAAPAAGLRNYITTIIVSNSHATVGTDVVLQDGSGGTVLLTIPAASLYGGAAITLPVPLRQPTTATALYCQNITTGSSTKVSVIGYKGA